MASYSNTWLVYSSKKKKLDSFDMRYCSKLNSIWLFVGDPSLCKEISICLDHVSLLSSFLIWKNGKAGSWWATIRFFCSQPWYGVIPVPVFFNEPTIQVTCWVCISLNSGLVFWGRLSRAECDWGSLEFRLFGTWALWFNDFPLFQLFHLSLTRRRWRWLRACSLS